MVKLWIANTDNEWFDFLSSKPSIDEVNFWQPSGDRTFRALQRGEFLVFRLKAPRNAIGGFGIFDRASTLPISTAWEAFGDKNGAPNLSSLRTQISGYRQELLSRTDYAIVCRILLQPIFLPESEWFRLPPSWPATGAQSGKTYSTDNSESRALWQKVMALRDWSLPDLIAESSDDRATPRYGEPVLIKPRLGQGAFRVAVIDAYGRQCAVSGGRVLPALEAAHIKPFGEGGEHEVANGLLLRRDIHRVFDAGYVTIDPDLRFVVSERVKTDFNNGEEYRRLHGRTLIVPKDHRLWPSAAALDWHNRNAFLDSIA